MQPFPQILIHRQWQNGGHTLAFLQLQHLTQRTPAPLRPGFRQLPNFFAEGDPAISEEQHPLMRVRDEGTDDDIILARGCRAAALAATPLGAEGFQRRTLHIAITRQRHHHGAGFDQAFIIHIGDAIHNLCHTRGCNLRANFA